jgi:ABC-type polysaccharide transport system permease subunit
MLDFTITEVVAVSGAIFLVVAPFVINARLAKQKNKSVNTILILTFFLSWFVTLIILFFPNEPGGSISRSTYGQSRRM